MKLTSLAVLLLAPAASAVEECVRPLMEWDEASLFTCFTQLGQTGFMEQVMGQFSSFIDMDCIIEATISGDAAVAKMEECINGVTMTELLEIGVMTGIPCLQPTEGSSTEDYMLCAQKSLSAIAPCFTVEDPLQMALCGLQTIPEIENMFQVIEEAPTCTTTALAELGACMESNMFTCGVECATELMSSVPMVMLQMQYNADLFNCAVLQLALADPMCAMTAGCCDTCSKYMQELTNCIAMDVMPKSLKVNEQCSLKCPSRRRDLGQGDCDNKDNSSSAPQATEPATVKDMTAEKQALVHCAEMLEGERRSLATVEHLMECTAAEYAHFYGVQVNSAAASSRTVGSVMAVLFVLGAIMW